ncbi:hypothetical protein AAC387_Pa01g2870 [Persea americana]
MKKGVVSKDVGRENHREQVLGHEELVAGEEGGDEVCNEEEVEGKQLGQNEKTPTNSSGRFSVPKRKGAASAPALAPAPC